MSDDRIVVIGVGNALRGDDGAGPAVADAVRSQAPKEIAVRVCEEEPTRLVDALGEADVALIVDAVSTGAPAGTVHRFDATETPLPSRAFRSSTHALGIGEAVELTRALGRLPRRTIAFGIEGSDFTARDGLTPQVEQSISSVVARVLEEVETCTSER
jgi:hydrogenase maturation protease